MLLNKPTCHVPNSDCLTASPHITLSTATQINFMYKIITPCIAAKSYKRQSVVSNVAIHQQILTGVTHTRYVPRSTPFWNLDGRQALTLILLMCRKGWANSIPIYIQQEETLHSLFISGNCSTCFGWYFHPSSGANTTVSTASGVCHTVTAICRYRGRVGTTLKPVPTLPR
jgi:hypothetical protein